MGVGNLRTGVIMGHNFSSLLLILFMYSILETTYERGLFIHMIPLDPIVVLVT